MELDQRDEEAHFSEGSASWSASIRLATVFSIVAALGALLLGGRVPETTIIVSVIVIGTMLSWFQLEEPPAAATVRQSRRHRR